jgi:putative PIN family toxin of toxin-antitoxin system
VKVVLDTNILVSGLLKPSGPSGMVIQMAVAGRFQVCYDARILLEYDAVLGRPKFGFNPAETTQLLAVLETQGQVGLALPLKRRLPDKTDEAFAEVAQGVEADYLVTGNKKDFPQTSLSKTRVLSPAEFLEVWRS